MRGWLNCSTGCPMLSCFNPACPYTDYKSDVFVNIQIPTEREFRMPNATCWERELWQTPRRTKRGLPAMKPAPRQAQRRVCY